LHVFLAVLCFLGGSLAWVSAVVIATQQLRRDGRIRDRFAVALSAVAGVWLLTLALWHLFAACGWHQINTILSNPLKLLASGLFVACLIACDIMYSRKKKPPTGS
jgi:hypothetical protein